MKIAGLLLDMVHIEEKAYKAIASRMELGANKEISYDLPEHVITICYDLYDYFDTVNPNVHLWIYSPYYSCTLYINDISCIDEDGKECETDFDAEKLREYIDNSFLTL